MKHKGIMAAGVALAVILGTYSLTTKNGPTASNSPPTIAIHATTGNATIDKNAQLQIDPGRAFTYNARNQTTFGFDINTALDTSPAFIKSDYNKTTATLMTSASTTSAITAIDTSPQAFHDGIALASTSFDPAPQGIGIGSNSVRTATKTDTGQNAGI